MATPAQSGFHLIQKVAPTFLGYTVVDKTWKENPSAVPLLTKNGASQTINASWSDGGFDAECEVVLNKSPNGAGAEGADSVLLDQGNTLTELTSPNASLRTWLIVEAPKNSEFGGIPLKQSLKLLLKDALTPG